MEGAEDNQKGDGMRGDERTGLTESRKEGRKGEQERELGGGRIEDNE